MAKTSSKKSQLGPKPSVKKGKDSQSNKVANRSKMSQPNRSTKHDKAARDSKTVKPSKDSQRPSFFTRAKRYFGKWRSRIKTTRAQHLHLHKSFRRSYREDYARTTVTPGLLSHAMITFKTIFRYWKTFLPLIALMVALYIGLVGLMSEQFYQKFQTEIDATSEELEVGQIGNFAKSSLILMSTVMSGGLNNDMDDAQAIFTVALFLIIWLVTIFLLRHFFAGDNPRLRDGLYNALGPLLSTLLIFLVICIQAIPIMLVIITYSAAVNTEFLATPFYALVYFLFAAVMILMSGYLISSSLMSLIAVTAPGMYPVRALMAASDLMAGRRMRLILRIIYLIFVVVIIYSIVMIPIIMLDLWLKSFWTQIADWPIVPFFLLVVTCFVFVYLTIYFYLYYRWLLDSEEK